MFNLTKGLIIVLFVILIILALVVIVIAPRIYRERPSPSPETSTPSPTFIPLPSSFFSPEPQATTLPSPVSQKIISRQELINLTPVETPEFNIEYFSTSDSIIVTIKKSPYEQSQAKAEEWFRQRGIVDFDAYKIEWSSYRYLE